MKLPSLEHFGRQNSAAQSQQFYDTDLVKAEAIDAQVKSIGEEISTISDKRLEFIINHINKLIERKIDGSVDAADAAEFNKIKGYVAGLKDIRRLFEDALTAKRNNRP